MVHGDPKPFTFWVSPGGPVARTWHFLGQGTKIL